MRCVAGVGLLLLGGCNQIFGLTPARTFDASIDVTPDTPHVLFTWQLATIQMSGAPATALSYPPFDASFAPQIRIATLDGPFEHADYLTSPEMMAGWIPIRDRSYIGTTWRLEYTFPGGDPQLLCGAPLRPCNAPHEVQWAPEPRFDQLGHLTVPRVGPTDRRSPPLGSGYKITPTNFSGGYTNPRVLTTGLWTDGLIQSPPSGSTVDYDFSSAISLSGPTGRPDDVPGARAMLVDFVIDTTQPPGPIPCPRVAAGSATIDPTLQAGVHTVQTVNWNRNTRSVDAQAIDTTILQRLTMDPLLGAGTSQPPQQSVVLYGAVPSIEFPGLAGIPPAFASVKLPVPAMQILLQCQYNRNPLPNINSPAPLDDFPRVLHAQLVVTRPVLNVTLAAGLETVIASSAAGGFKIAFPAPLATKMTLNTPTGVIDLTGPNDQIPIGSPAGSVTLTFTPDTSTTDVRADYHDVILYKIDSSGLTPVRIFTVTTPPQAQTGPQVHIDGSLLSPATDYVFEIRTYKGHMMAPHGDFAPVDYPYGAAIVFTRTFKTS